jgi:hypothetical protein
MAAHTCKHAKGREDLYGRKETCAPSSLASRRKLCVAPGPRLSKRVSSGQGLATFVAKIAKAILSTLHHEFTREDRFELSLKKHRADGLLE